MKSQTLVLLAFSVSLGACSADAPTAPSAAQNPSSPFAYSVQAVVSQGNLGSSPGIRSPAMLDVVFRSTLGEPLEIQSARASLLDDAGVELANQSFGATSGTLRFRPTWEGEAIGRKLRMNLEVLVAGTTRSVEFTLTL